VCDASGVPGAGAAPKPSRIAQLDRRPTVHLHLLTVHQLISAGQDVVVAGKVTHGIGKVVKFLIVLGILIGVVLALVISSLMRRRK
jgi:hypothetical protein